MKNRRKRKKRKGILSTLRSEKLERKSVSNIQIIAWHAPGKQHEHPISVRCYIYAGDIPLMLQFVDVKRLELLISRLTDHRRRMFPSAPSKQRVPPTGTQVEQTVRDADDPESAPTHFRRVESVTVKSTPDAVLMILNLEADGKSALRWGSPELLGFFVAELSAYKNFVFGGEGAE